MADKILKTINEVQTVNAKLREENARLRAALQKIEYTRHDYPAAEMREVARAALRGGGE